ncbi:hypothetical protein BH11BAC3_BH11BAC3_21230 [soil metagenome]
MIKPIDHYFHKKEEPVKSCLLALRAFILQYNENINESFKYGMPFYSYHKKMCCYLWTQKKSGIPYIGFVEGSQLNHPQLIAEKRARMKILLIDANEDLPIKIISNILKDMVALYKK